MCHICWSMQANDRTVPWNRLQPLSSSSSPFIDYLTDAIQKQQLTKHHKINKEPYLHLHIHRKCSNMYFLNNLPKLWYKENQICFISLSFPLFYIYFRWSLNLISLKYFDHIIHFNWLYLEIGKIILHQLGTVPEIFEGNCIWCFLESVPKLWPILCRNPRHGLVQLLKL
jgi:hypothetical protein